MKLKLTAYLVLPIFSVVGQFANASNRSTEGISAPACKQPLEAILNKPFSGDSISVRYAIGDAIMRRLALGNDSLVVCNESDGSILIIERKEDKSFGTRFIP